MEQDTYFIRHIWHLLNGRRHAKTYLWVYAKAQISLRMRAVWSGPSLSASRIIGHYRMYEWRANARMRLCACAEWIWICAFCACPETLFRLTRPKYTCRQQNMYNFSASVYALYYNSADQITVDCLEDVTESSNFYYWEDVFFHSIAKLLHRNLYRFGIQLWQKYP